MKVSISVERTHNGLVLSTMHNGYYVHRLYQGYTKREAIEAFKDYLKEL